MPAIRELDLEARVGAIRNRHPAVGLAVGVVRDGALGRFSGHGLADIAAGTPVTEDTVFRVASVTKTFTAIAVMQLWERGLVDLDAPANRYLRAYRLVPARAGFRPATVRHLLTHTAGIREVLHPSGLLRPRDLGETVPLGRPVPSLAEYYRGGLRVDAEPGTRWCYTNHGFATLGQLVEDVTGEPLDRYLRRHVFEPLGMTATDLARSERVAAHLATGYELRSGGARPVADYEVVTAGGGAVYSSPRDMARYVAALLGGGANRHGGCSEPATLATMFEPHHQPDPRVPGFGLGFFRADLGGHLAVEHDGILPGFDAQLLLAPGDGVGVLAFANGARGGLHWLAPEDGGLLRRLLGVPRRGIRSDLPHHPRALGRPLRPLPVRRPPDRPGTLRPRRRAPGRGPAGAFGSGPQPDPRAGAGLLHPDDEHDPDVFRIELPWSGGGTAGSSSAADPAGPPGRSTSTSRPCRSRSDPRVRPCRSTG